MGDSRSSCHVCNDPSLLWDIRVRDDPILLRQTLGELKLYVTGTVKLECQKKEGIHEIPQLYNTLYIPQAKVDLFSLQKMRKAYYWVVESHRIGIADPQREWLVRGEHR